MKIKIFFPTYFQTTLKYHILWKFIQWEPCYSIRTDG